MFQKLSLLDKLYKKFANINLADVALLSCQHILQSNYITLEYLFMLGLKPENTFILGKSYSTSKEVMELLKKRGVYVHQHSLSFNSHESWDTQFETYVFDFLRDVVPKINNLISIKKIVVVDDGGFVIEQVNKLQFSQKVQCIEWTSSGYRKLLNLKMNYPVINVARSKTKLDIESPIIGSGVVQKIIEQHPDVVHSSKKALVIGAGSIGLAVKKSLEEINKKVDIVDVDKPLSDLELALFDTIIGCTGENILGINDLNDTDKMLLVSASSSDREFSAVTVRENFPQNSNPHENYTYKGTTLVNSGFPINFDGEVQFLPNEKIQITLGLIFAGVCLVSSKEFNKGLNEFPTDIGDEIANEYLTLSRQDDQLAEIRM